MQRILDFSELTTLGQTSSFAGVSAFEVVSISAAAAPEEIFAFLSLKIKIIEILYELTLISGLK